MRRITAVTIVALGLLLGAAVAQAQTPGGGPLAAADPEGRPIGAVRLSGPSGGPIAFPIFALSLGVEQAGGTAVGAGGGAGRPVFDDAAVIRAVDAGTPRLWQMVASGQHLQRAEIALCRAGVDCSFTGDSPSANAYVVYTLEDATVSGLETSETTVDGTLTERVDFAYTRLSVQAGGAPPICWDLRQNRAC